MKIYQNNDLTQVQRNFNRKLSGVRQIVERCIGVLKARFRCILGERKLRYNPTKVGHIIYSCATLHNILIANRYDVMNEIDQNLLQNLLNRRNENIDPLQQQQQQHRQVAINRRDQLANFLEMMENE